MPECGGCKSVIPCEKFTPIFHINALSREKVKWYFRDISYNGSPTVWCYPEQLCLSSRRGFTSLRSAHSSSHSVCRRISQHKVIRPTNFDVTNYEPNRRRKTTRIPPTKFKLINLELQAFSMVKQRCQSRLYKRHRRRLGSSVELRRGEQRSATVPSLLCDPVRR